MRGGVPPRLFERSGSTSVQRSDPAGMATQKEQIHQVVLDTGRPLSDLEIVGLLRIGGQTPENTVRRDLSQEGRFQRGVDGRWAPPEWRQPLVFAPAALETDSVDVAKLVTPVAGMETYVAHQTIRNIVVSYEAGTDPVAEAVQNALDATADGGRISVSYDPPSGRLVVDDDGAGLTREAFAQLVSPNVSTKQSGDSVGYKGVGLTFLCFSSDDVEIVGDGWTAAIHHARQWVDDPFGWRWPTQPVVLFSEGSPRSGLRYSATLAERARHHLSTISSAEQLALALRMHTPLGALAATKVATVTAEVPEAGQAVVAQQPLLPTDVVAAADRLELPTAAGSPQPTYDGTWQVWSPSDLRKLVARRRQGGAAGRLSDVVSNHSVRAFGYLAKSREALTALGDGSDSYELLGTHGVRVFARNQPLSRPPQPVRLTGSTGYFNRLWIRFDVDAEADIGRKSLPAIEHDLQELAAIVGGELVSKGAGWLYAEDPEIRSRDDEGARRSKTNRWEIDGETIEYWDVRDEQDVVALYNRFTGTGLFQHLPIVASWGSTGVYDARARCLPALVHPSLEQTRPGVDAARDVLLRLEFKLRAKDILRDVEARKKSLPNIDLLVAWDVGNWPDTNEWEILSAAGRSRGERRYAGVTHLIRRQGASEVVTRVIVLSELLDDFRVKFASV